MNKFKIAKLPNYVYKNNNYRKANYTGITKILYTLNHKIMEIGISCNFNEHILDVGGGAEPHINFMKLDGIKSYSILDSSKFKKNILKLNQSKKFKSRKIKIYFLDFKKKKSYTKKNYTRLISSHTYEHFEKFEENFIKLLSLLRKDALISTALPCDPGMIWRLLQFMSYLKQKNIYKWKNFKQKDLDDSRDHITSVQNILKVFKYYFLNIKTFYFPFLIPIIGLNIFLIIQTKLSDFKN